jgi:hypothetical protein
VTISTGTGLDRYHLFNPASHTDLLIVVLSIIQEKVNNPSPEDPFEPDIAAVMRLTVFNSSSSLTNPSFQQLKEDKSKFLATAKEWTKKCASSTLYSHCADPNYRLGMRPECRERAWVLHAGVKQRVLIASWGMMHSACPHHSAVDVP